MKYDAYIDSTLHNDWNVKFNPKLCKKLESGGFKIYLPQRDTDQDNKKEIYNQNYQGLKNSRNLIAIAKNESPNWGVELGFMHGLDKRIIILTEEGHNIPLMGKEMATEIIEADELDNFSSYLHTLSKLLKI